MHKILSRQYMKVALISLEKIKFCNENEYIWLTIPY